MTQWIEPQVGQIWRDADRDILFLITEVRSNTAHPIKVLMDKKSNIFGKITDSQYSITYMKNLCVFQGKSKINLDELFEIAE